MTDLQLALEAKAEAKLVENLPEDQAKAVVSSNGVYHKVSAHGCAGPLAGWTAACGWRFAANASQARLLPQAPDRVHYKFLYAKCVPAKRAALKEACAI